MIEYSWKFDSMAVRLSENGLDNVVHTVFWTLIGCKSGVSSHVYGSVGLPPPDGNFTPYEELTKSQVQSWVELAIGLLEVEEYKKIIAQQIKRQETPVNAVLQPPW